MILIVDDEDQIRLLSRAVLEQAGYRVQEAATAAAALLTLSEPGTQIDVVVTDVLMPGLDGLSLAREIRRIAPRVQIVVISAHLASDHAWPEDLLDLQLVTKPFTLAALKNAVADAMLRRRARG